ncbi:MAG: hypothetical protein MJ197_10205, partial [Bacteroidales bacterium]|nr:hypothetical protein [Bacteroidales bacterium]
MGTNVSHIARFACVIYAILTTLICSAAEYSVKQLTDLPYDAITDTFIVPEGDVVTITDNLTLKNTRKLAVYGKLIFSGNMVNEGGKFDVYGSVELAANKTNTIKSGTLTIHKTGSLTCPGTFTNNAIGTVIVGGTITTKDFTNNGTVTIAEGATVSTSNNFNNNSNLTLNGIVIATNAFYSNNATNSNLNLDGTISAKTLNVANIVTQGGHSQLNITASITNNANTLKIPNDITLTGG